MFNEVWRQERDYFFEASMNGVDWQKMHDKYAQLLPYVADRYSLTYMLGDMIGELSNSHTYVGGGEYPDLHPVNVGLLGADYEPDQASGMYRIKKIYPGENWDADLRSPLTEPGINVKEGDYLLAVNGQSAAGSAGSDRVDGEHGERDRDADGELEAIRRRRAQCSGQADQRRIQSARTEHDRDQPQESGRGHRRQGRLRLSAGHGRAGLNEFVKQYFPQIRKQGMIIDVRYNGGGFVDELIFERLRRILMGMDSARNWESGHGPAERLQRFHGLLNQPLRSLRRRSLQLRL